MTGIDLVRIEYENLISEYGHRPMTINEYNKYGTEANYGPILKKLARIAAYNAREIDILLREKENSDKE